MKKIFSIIIIFCLTGSCYVDEELADNEFEVIDNDIDILDNETIIINCFTCSKKEKVHEICDNGDGTGTIIVTDKGETKLTQTINYEAENLTLEKIKEEGCGFFRNFFSGPSCLTCKKKSTVHEICDNGDNTATLTVKEKDITKLSKLFQYDKEGISYEEIKDQGCEFFKNYFDKKDCLTCSKSDKTHEICDNSDNTATITIIEKGIIKLTKVFEYEKEGISYKEIKDQGCKFFKKYLSAKDCLTCKDFSICDNGDNKTFTYTNFFKGNVYSDVFEYGDGLDFETLKAVGCKKEKIFNPVKNASINLP